MSTPAAVYAVGQRLLAPLAPAASNVMALNRMVASGHTDWETADVAARLGLNPMSTVREVLRDKAAAAVR